MNPRAKKLLPGIFILALGLMLAGRATAQTFTSLYKFSVAAGGFYSNVFFYYNSDGCYPSGGLLLSGNTLYGVAGGGGVSGTGTVYSVNTDGSDFTVLHAFSAPTQTVNIFSSRFYNSDGGSPSGNLILSGNTLYGTAATGGTSGFGTLFAINTDGTDFTNLHTFIGPDGNAPVAGLILSSNILYGVTSAGGSSNSGTVFAINTDGTGFTNLHNFTRTSDGAGPSATLLLLGGTLYGVASSGGSSSNGTIFAINTDGTGFTNLHNFTGGNNGHTPECTLLLSGNTLYGTAEAAGLQGVGTVFAMNTNGTGFTNIYNNPGFFGETDGAVQPFSGLILLGGTFFGTATAGGAGGEFSDGYVYSLKTNGTGFTITYDFPYNYYQNNGYISSLILSNYTLYGTTQLSGNPGRDTNGMSLGVGSVYSISFMPQLKIAQYKSNIVLSWPTNMSVVDTSWLNLQCATNLGSSTVWSAVSPAPSIVNGQYTVTNAISGSQMFYRLSQ